jgi:neutral ceramidase
MNTYPAILHYPIQTSKQKLTQVFAEFTTMAGRRLREAVKETLINNGNGEFDDNTHVVIAGLTNTYSQYVATFEEYKQQRYEVVN